MDRVSKRTRIEEVGNVKVPGGKNRLPGPKLIKNIGKQIINIYIFGKSCFLDLAKGPCGGNLRKRFKLWVMANGCRAARFVALNEDVSSDQCQFFKYI